MSKPKETEAIRGNVQNSNAIHGNILPRNPISGKASSQITDASETKKGIIRIATEEEAIDGELRNVAITPHTLSTATHFVFEQGIASAVWEIEHNLNKKPSVTVVDTADEEQIPDRKAYNGKNKITLYFLSEFAGKAYLN